MSQREGQAAAKSWSYYREAFNRASRLFPEKAILVTLIDQICELGYAERLYAGASLDNLVIKTRPRQMDRRQTILVLPRTDGNIELHFYPNKGDVEISTVTKDQAEAVLARLLPRLQESRKPSTNGTDTSESES